MSNTYPPEFRVRALQLLAEVRTELIRRRGPWRTIEQVELASLECVWWWKNQRLHGELEMRTPVEVEQAHCAGLETALGATACQNFR